MSASAAAEEGVEALRKEPITTRARHSGNVPPGGEMTYLHAMTVAELEDAMAKGSAAAAWVLSRLTRHGWRGTTADPVRALSLLRHAAVAGHAIACRALGDHYHRGDGVPEDHAEAMAWWLRAADLGDSAAMSNLIPLARSADPAEAAEGRRWLVAAAALGQPYAVSSLAELRQTGAIAEADLTAFAATPLAELAGRAPANGTGFDVTLEMTGAFGTLAPVMLSWIEAIEARWPDLEISTSFDGAEIDFPSPDGVPDAANEGDSLEVTVKSAARHVEAWCGFDGDSETWSCNLMSFEPHPSADEARWLVDTFLAAAQAAGVEAQPA